jgi:hypothetical protein
MMELLNLLKQGSQNLRLAGLANFTHRRFKPWIKPRLKPGWAKSQKPTPTGQNYKNLLENE